MTTDVIIPVYKPDDRFLKLLDCLKSQTLKPGKIIVVNTEKAYFEQLMTEESFREAYRGVTLMHVTEREFDHGGTRNLSVTVSKADCFIMMTQDAMPVDENLFQNLLYALEDEKTAAAYARQYPRQESDELERFIRSFNYGSEPLYKNAGNIEQMGIKTYFCSNVCAAYKREIFQQLGGYIPKTIFNEDMIYAAKAIKAGYSIQYVPEAAVYHAHDYTNKQQFRRNFDIGVSHTDHPEVFSGLSSESEGIRMIKQASIHLIKRGKPLLIIKLFFQSFSKYMGYYYGKRYKNLSRRKILKYTMNKNYWK